MPTILALETSSETASLALLHAGRVSARRTQGVQNHSLHVLPLAQELLQAAGIALSDCDAIAFGMGPGSFTGVRTACGIAQGLAFACGIPLLPQNTLHAMAEQVRQLHEAAGTDCAGLEVCPVLDARMEQLYWAHLRWQDGAWHALQEAALVNPAQLVATLQEGRAARILCGNGVPLLPDFAHAEHGVQVETRVALADAEPMLALAERDLAAGRGLPAAQAQPLYLRNKVAYTSAERAQGLHK